METVQTGLATMRLSAFAKNVASIMFGRAERRFANDVLRELGIRPEATERPIADSAKAPAKPVDHTANDRGGG